MSTFLERLQSSKTLVADGATGTNLLACGLPAGLIAENWVLDQPHHILKLEQDFVAAGSDIILTSTFNATPMRLSGTPLEGRAAEINQRAVELARQASAGTATLIAGSMGPVGKLLKPYGPADPQDVVSAYAEQARALSQAGVDLLLIETQFDLAEAKAAIQGARSVSTLPIVCSFSYDRGRRTMMGVKPAQMASELPPLGVDVLGINCGRSLEENLENLRELRQATTLPIWFKPNAGVPKVDNDGNTYYDTTPEAMGALVSTWLQAGANVIGGCCGTSPQHLRQIALAVKS
ncbi:MAG: homocysteine S-methyltransferase family protein [Anaerolineales bacterium]|nr:homocysteine S-methyltransferase family protein [Anaerolineales bacterium]